MTDVNLGTKESCTCSECVHSCYHKPGWFKPYEIERVADFLGISLKELFDTSLGVDYYLENLDQEDSEMEVGSEEWKVEMRKQQTKKALFVIAPSQEHMQPGGMYPGRPEGKCVFLKDDRCAIHVVKPYQCRQGFHDKQDMKGATEANRVVALEWKAHADQIKELLGRSPEVAELDEMVEAFSPLSNFFRIMDSVMKGGFS